MASRSAVPGEYVGDLTLLEVCHDGTVFLGTDVGAVITAHVLGGDVPMDKLKKPISKKEAAALARIEKYQVTPEQGMRWNGAMSAYAPRGQLVIRVFQDPKSKQECVAGWDQTRKQWVIE